jgi:hypothetical protein
MTTVAGTGARGYSGDGGKATLARLSEPFHCDLDGKGTLYIAEAGNHCVRSVDLKTGIIRTVAGTGKKGYSGDGGPATRAPMNEPYAVAITPQGDLYSGDRLTVQGQESPQKRRPGKGDAAERHSDSRRCLWRLTFC